MRRDDPIILFNDTGQEFAATLLELTKKTLSVQVVNMRQVERESPLKITLALAITPGQQIDYGLQKAVELGVYKIIPLSSEFSNVKLHAEYKRKKLRHWRNIISATEQCGRNRLAKLLEPVLYNEWLSVENTATGVDPAS